MLLVAVAAVALQWRQERAGTQTLAFVSAGQMPAEPARAEAGSAASAPMDASPKAAATSPVSAPPAGRSPAVASTAAAPAKPPTVAPSEPAPAGAGRIALQFEGESWVEIRSGSGKLLVASLHSAGTERFVSGLPPFEVVIGNAQQVRLTYNDKPVDLSPYVKVEVARFTLQ